ncbi:hypothetical protein [Lachnoclostridium phytofermentans]|uniref:hypothetical protein n=1 Tax=Lachnoclostridium phytofermentans TaxID=66219 RepID=UPI0012DE0ABF|nr:hypothetical protein [Lachnoclostridium phytofermentans]
MKDVDIIKRLRRICYFDIALLLFAAGLRFILDLNYIILFLVVAFSCFIIWKYYRCPYCKESLDTRLKLNENTHCHNCGHIISQWKNHKE